MRTPFFLALAAMSLAVGRPAAAQFMSTNWTTGFVNNGVVPDNDLSGLTLNETLTGWSGNVTNLSVTLNLSGGWNGDIYAYLYHDGVMSVLLNQVGNPANGGLGYGDSGFNVTLTSDPAYASIHNYQDSSPTIVDGSVLGHWQPDGAGLGGFDGQATSGTWSFYFVDLSPGGVMTINSVGLQMDVIPEPSTWLLATLGALGSWVARRKVGSRPGSRQ